MVFCCLQTARTTAAHSNIKPKLKTTGLDFHEEKYIDFCVVSKHFPYQCTMSKKCVNATQNVYMLADLLIQCARLISSYRKCLIAVIAA